MKNNSTYTVYACYLGYVVQAIVNNLAPLLFLTFEREFRLSTSLVGLLISVNFGVQILVDLFAARFVDRIGYRVSIVGAHIFSAAGLAGLGIFPFLTGNPYTGLVIATCLCAVGGGLIEVLVSPIVQAIPSSGAKESAMSLLHSFYCWGQVAVVLFSTLGFRLFGMEHWSWLPLLWALAPALNIFLFSQVPIYPLVEEEQQLPGRELLSMRMFWLLIALMVCAGASELAMSQWASLFAEEGLGQSKTVGDLLGPCLFAVLMGSARMYYGKFGGQIDLRRFMMGSGLLCAVSYLMAVFMPHPLLALMGCSLCGLSVGIMWPGTFSLAAKLCPQGGTMMFALLAIAGDFGCLGGPTLVNIVSGFFPKYGVKAGLLAATLFPAVMILLLTKNRQSTPMGEKP